MFKLWAKKLVVNIFFLQKFLQVYYFYLQVSIFLFGYNYLTGLIIVSLMVIIFISDFKYMIILDSPLVVSVVLIIILKLIYFGFKTTIYSIISGLILFLIMLLIEKTWKLNTKKKDSLGGGDIKFAFLMGLTLDVKLGIVALVLSTF